MNGMTLKLYKDENCLYEFDKTNGGKYAYKLNSVSEDVPRLVVLKMWAKNTGELSLLDVEMKISFDIMDCAVTFPKQDIAPNQVIPFEIALDIPEKTNINFLEIGITSKLPFEVFGSRISDLEGVKFYILDGNVLKEQFYLINICRINTNKQYELRLTRRKDYDLKLGNNQSSKATLIY